MLREYSRMRAAARAVRMHEYAGDCTWYGLSRSAFPGRANQLE